MKFSGSRKPPLAPRSNPAGCSSHVPARRTKMAPRKNSLDLKNARRQKISASTSPKSFIPKTCHRTPSLRATRLCRPRPRLCRLRHCHGVSGHAIALGRFVHGLCWVHGERKIDRLIPLTTKHRAAKELAQDTFWEIYKSLQAYREQPTELTSEAIRRQFKAFCQKKTGYPDLNEALIRLYSKREEFLAVLNHPHLALHNNLSENDIREYARLRKISGGTRSAEGRRCRDTFMSVKKTCRKLGVNFQQYLRDRIRGGGEIPLFSELLPTTSNTSRESSRTTALRCGIKVPSPV